jgi:hypothetical protein
MMAPQIYPPVLQLWEKAVETCRILALNSGLKLCWARLLDSIGICGCQNLQALWLLTTFRKE